MSTPQIAQTQATAAWFNDLAAELRRFVHARVRDPVSADDVLQDALLRIARGMDDVANLERLGPWAYAVARNCIADHYRQRSRMPSTAALDPSPDLAPLPELAQNDEPAPAAAALAGWLRGAVDSLPEPYRSTLRATELEGVGYEELARREGVSVSAIKSRVSRGRAHLRRAAEHCCEIERDVRGAVVGLRNGNCGCDL